MDTRTKNDMNVDTHGVNIYNINYCNHILSVWCGRWWWLLSQWWHNKRLCCAWCCVIQQVKYKQAQCKFSVGLQALQLFVLTLCTTTLRFLTTWKRNQGWCRIWYRLFIATRMTMTKCDVRTIVQNGTWTILAHICKLVGLFHVEKNTCSEFLRELYPLISCLCWVGTDACPPSFKLLCLYHKSLYHLISSLFSWLFHMT